MYKHILNLQQLAQMSTNYVQQPPTSGKVVLYTSHGQIDVQLWAKEAPLACRNFIQLCLQGYYDNTIFHRLIPSFMIQGGDPTGTGNGGSSIFNGAFQDQFHQRLKFTHRGIVAMASSGRNTNQSQFFITLGQCQHLNKKNTIFGRVAGNTIYNLMSMQSIDVDSNDRPIDPPYIKKTKVIINPFEDITPRNLMSKQEERAKMQKQGAQKKERQAQLKQKRMLQNKKLNKRSLLSFEDEEQPASDKIVSSHDALNDSKLSKKKVISPQEINAKLQAKQAEAKRMQQIKAKMINPSQQQQFLSTQGVGQKIRQQIKLHRQQEPKIQDEVNKYKTRLNPQTGKMELFWGDEPLQREQEQKSEEVEEYESQKLHEIRQKQKREFQAIKSEQLRFKQVQQGSLNRQQKVNLAQQKTLLSNVQKRRLHFIQKRQLERHQGTMLQRLQSFKNKLKKDKKIEDADSWTTHRLKFHIDSDNAYRLIAKAQRAGDMDDDDGGLMVVSEPYKKTNTIDIHKLYEQTQNEHSN